MNDFINSFFSNPNVTPQLYFVSGMIVTLSALVVSLNVVVLYKAIQYQIHLARWRTDSFGDPLPRWVVILDEVQAAPRRLYVSYVRHGVMALFSRVQS